MAAKKKRKLTREEADYLKFTKAWLGAEETVLEQLGDQIAFNRNEIDQHRSAVRYRRTMRQLQIRKIEKVRREFSEWKETVGLP